MSTIQDLFRQAQLAEAAYANFFDNAGNLLTTNAAVITALQIEGFSESQATAFLQTWRVISQFTESGLLNNGFSAALFERLDANQQPTGQYTLGVAGSTQLVDFAGADLDLTVTGVALNQLVSMVNYVLRLKAGANGFTQQLTPVGRGLTSNVVSGVGPGINPAQLTVSGHSLGGYLSQVYQRIFGSTGVYTYNALGLVNPNASIFDRITDLLGLPPGRFSSGPGENLLVPGEPAQLIGTVQGNAQIRVFSEAQSTTTDPVNTIPAHRVSPLTDSLAVYDLFAKLDPALNTTDPAVGIGKITDILKAASNKPALSLEAALDSLRKLFKDPSPSAPTIVPTATDNREQYYQNLIGLQDRLALYAEALKTDSLTTTSDVQLAGLAQGSEAIAYRYALKELNPFAIVGNSDLYSPHNVNGELDLYSPVTGSGLTREYLADRAEMLGWKNLVYQKDGNVALRGNRIESYQFTDKSIKDERTGQDLTLTVVGRNSLLINNPAKFIFGSDADETLLGGNVAAGDHLYGGGGADVLQGNQGNDYLEGGGGNDTYVWNTGDGFDTILDTDGVGRLVVNGRTISGGIGVAQGDYIGADKQILMHFEGDLIAGGVLIVNGDLRIENFTSGDLSIVLSGQGGAAEIQPTVTSFHDPSNNGALYFGTEGDDHYVGRSSVFVGKSGNDFLEAAPGGGGVFSGGAGDDMLIGGPFRVTEIRETGGDFNESLGGIEPPGVTVQVVTYPEYHFGDAGRDIILGGEGIDYISGDFRDFNISAFQFQGSSFRYFENGADPLDSTAWYSDPFFTTGGEALPPTDEVENPNRFPGDYLTALRHVLGISRAGPSTTHYDDFIDAGDGNDEVSGGYGSDILYGSAGDDILEGDYRGFISDPIGARIRFEGLVFDSSVDQFRDEGWRREVVGLFGAPGDDFLDGGDGNDRLTDSEGGNDVLLGGSGNDVIRNVDTSSDVAFSNYLSGGDGDDDLTSHNFPLGHFDTIFGGSGNDRLTLGAGNAYLDGGPGDDLYRISANFAFVTVSEFDEIVGNFDQLTVLFPTGPADLTSSLSISRDESNLYLGHGGIPDRITIQNWFSDDAYKIEQIATEQTIIVDRDGEGGALPIVTRIAHSFDLAAIESRFSTSTAAADFLWGSNADEHLAGGLGDDTAFGNAGLDTLAGNEGQDTLDGGEDGDTYAFNIGDGIDHIRDTGSFGSDAIAFGPGITPEMLTLGLGSLLITVGENGDAIHIEGFDPNNARESGNIELFRFADGVQLTYGELVARGFDIVGTAADEVLQGTSVNDHFVGGAGNDTYLFGRGFGRDLIEDLDTVGLDTDTVRLGADIAPADIAITRAGDFITLAINGMNDQLSIRWQPEQGYGIERVEFSGGTVWDAAALEAMAASSTNTAPTVANPLMDQAAQKDVLFGFHVPADAFHDMDPGEILDYSATLANGNPLPSWLVFDAASRQFTGTPAASDIGAISIQVTAIDLAGASATDDFQLAVSDGGKGHEVNSVGTDHFDDRGDDYRKREDERDSKLDGRKHDDRDDDRSDHKADRMADCLAAYVESKPRCDFEALAHELERSDRHGEALNAQEIARRWQAVGRYTGALVNEHDEDARGGAGYRVDDHSLLGGGVSGGGFGYSGSSGAPHRVANLQTLQGLAEGFQRLHS